MAILVGIDEAGYGPHLGPLVVAAAALEFPGDALPDPDLWSALRGHVRKRPGGSSGRVVVCDSKVAYGGAGRGLATLERAVLGFLGALGRRPGCFRDLLTATAVTAGPDGDENPAERPWHRPQAMPLPAAAGTEEVESAAGRLGRGLGGVGARAAGLWVNVASADRLNRLIGVTRNKASALFALTAELLTEIQGRWPQPVIHVTMDRHGGRRYYAGLLAGAYPMATVETLEEAPDVSRYGLARPGGAPVVLTIRERCETWSLATALASMAAKYVRELHMLQFNAYFREQVPGLRPTAGYGLDAWRFLKDVAAARAAAGVPDAAILRSR